MAVQKDRKTRSRRGMRRSHDHLTNPCIGFDPTSGEPHLRHHVSRMGFYKGKEVIESVDAAADNKEGQ